MTQARERALLTQNLNAGGIDNMMPYYKNNETFMKLWNEIPEVINYRMYINLLNEIDNECMDDFITKTEEKTLIQALETYMIIRKIKKEEG